MKRTFIHWPTLWHFCSQETWAISLAGSFFAGLMFVSATIHFIFQNGILAITTLVCAVLMIVSIAAFVICLKLLSKVYYVALLDEIGVPVDAHIIDKLYAGKSLKLLSDREIQELRESDVEVTPDLYQVKYRYRVKQDEHVRTDSLEYDEVFDTLLMGQRIPIIVLPCRTEIARIDEEALMKHYREQIAYWWDKPQESASLAQFKGGY